MWNNTRITKLLGIRYPIWLGPMGGGFSTPELLGIVSNQGGLGSFGAYTLTREQILEAAVLIRTRTDKPFNINLWVSDVDSNLSAITKAEIDKISALYKPYFDELNIPMPVLNPDIPSKFESQVEAVFEVKPAVFSFVFGIPSKAILQECRRLHIMTVGSATSLDEAMMLADAGVDAVIAAGFEAGGHRPTFLTNPEKSLVGTFALVQQIKSKIDNPVIAAGGIADGRGVAAALTLGADAVQIGTAFLACQESNATTLHREMLFSAIARNTVVSKSYTGRMGRMLANRIVEDIPNNTEVLPFPLQNRMMIPLKTEAGVRGRTDLMSFWAGQGAPLLKHRQAGYLMQALIADTPKFLSPGN